MQSNSFTSQFGDKGYLVLLAELRVILCAAGYKHT